MEVELLESLFLKNNMYGGNKENFALLKIIVVIVILFAVYSYFENKNKPPQNNNTQEQTTDVIVQPKQIGYSNIYPVLRDYDYRTYNDDLTPPRKRDDYNLPVNVLYPNRFGIYTQGGPNAFKKMGYLNNKTADPGDPYKFLTLMGRQKYYNSNTYEYYVVSTNKDENIKFDLEQIKREIFTGDTVKVPQISNADYEVNIDKVLDFEYNPFVL